MRTPPRIISSPRLPLEALKNRFLAALYTGRNLDGLFEQAAAQAAASETEEKYLRQILTACRRFGQTGHKGFTRLQARLRNRARCHEPGYTTARSWKAGLGLKEWQLDQVFAHAITFQLTSGCSNFCRRCNEWALPGIRRHFTRHAAVWMIKELRRRGNHDLALYGGSDPLDWTDPPHDISSLLGQISGPVQFSILTKIPRGKLDLAETLVRQKIPLSVSLTDRNRARIRQVEKQLGATLSKQHATSNLLIAACLDEDFITTKPSITDAYGTEISTDGAFIVIPAFTSALYPFGHKKIPVTRETQFFPVKKLGRPALLVDYFKPIEVEGPGGRYHLNGLVDVQVENIILDNGEYELTPPGMRSIKEYFEIFDDRARQQRKKMTLSVVRRLKKQWISREKFRNLAPDSRHAYLAKLSQHLDFTRKSTVAQARVSAAAYFLWAVRAYLAAAPQADHEIIAHLTQKEFARLPQSPPVQKPGSGLVRQFSDPAENAWALFRYHVLNLVHGGHPSPVDEFIANFPAQYDPAGDRFIPAVPSHL